MRVLSSKWILIAFLVFATCFMVTNGRRGGGSRGGGSRGGSRGSSRSSSSSGSSSSRGSTMDRSRDRGRTETRYPSPPAPPPQPKPQPPAPKPSAPREPVVHKQPAQNPNYREPGTVNNQQPPPYSPRERPPPYSPAAPNQGVAPPPYSPSGGQPSVGVPGANYPRQPGFPTNPQQSGGVAPPAYPGNVQSGNYPRQPGFPTNPQQSGGVAPPAYPGNVQSGNYPRQPGVVPPPSYPGNVQSGNYPRQPGGVPNPSYPGSVQSGNYPRQPGVGIPGANYPRQQNYPPQTLGSNVWHPQSGMPSPAYMNHGGLPTGANMNSQPLKQKGFLGSIMGMGSSKPHKNKYYGSQPSPYGMGGRRGGMGMGAAGLGAGLALGGAGGFLAGRASTAAMYSIFPYMVMRSSSNMFMPRYGGYGYYGHGYGHGYYGNGYGHGYGGGNDHTRYDVYNNEYVGRCNRPLTPDHAKVVCNSTHNEVDCGVTCEEGYLFPDNSTYKTNKCWHAGGVWKPTKNFPACEPVCHQTCLNGGKCASPGVCGCTSEYRGPNCEFYFLNCDIRRLANGNKIRWVCTHSKNGTSCKVRCRSPPDVSTVTPPESVYTCTPEGVWTPSSMPACVMPEAESNNTTTENPEKEPMKEEVKESA